MLANVGKNVQTKKFLVQKLNEPAVETYFFIGTNLRCRKNPLFFDARPSDAEKIRCFLTLEPPAQKKLVVF